MRSKTRCARSSASRTSTYCRRLPKFRTSPRKRLHPPHHPRRSAAEEVLAVVRKGRLYTNEAAVPHRSTSSRRILNSQSIRASLRGTFRQRQIVRRVDQRHMRKCLREISHLPLPDGVVFLGQQPHVVAQGKQPLEYLTRLILTSHQRQIIRVPERAGQKGSLARRQSIDVGLSLVALYQAVA